MSTKLPIVVVFCAFACSAAARVVLSSKDSPGVENSTLPQSYGDEGDSSDQGNAFDDNSSIRGGPGLGGITGSVGAGDGGDFGGGFDLHGPGGGSLGISGGFGGGAGGELGGRLGFEAGPGGGIQAGAGLGGGLGGGVDGEGGRLGGGLGGDNSQEAGFGVAAP